MAYFIITVVVLLFILVYQYLAFQRIYYVNCALNQIRELRHDVALDLSKGVKGDMPLQEVIEHQEFLKNVNAIIEHFDRFKTNFIRFKSVKNVYTNIIYSSERLAVVEKERAASLDKYKARMGQSVKLMFNAIPFYRVRLTLYLLRILGSVLVKLGIVAVNVNLERVERLSRIERDIFNRNRHNGACFN